MLLCPKPVPHTPSPSENRKGLTLGSASLVIGMDGGSFALKGYEPLPDWVQEGQEPASELRETESARQEYDEKRIVPAGERLDDMIKDQGISTTATSQQNTARTTNGGGLDAKEKTLDDWLAEDEVEDDNDSDDEESEDESEEEEESDEDEEENSDDVEEAEESDQDEHQALVK